MTRLLFVLSLFALVLGGASRPAFAEVAADTPLRILQKPTATSQGCSESQGKTELRVAFGSTGTIEDVSVKKSSGCAAFDRSAVEAARRIEFTPATKDDKPITVSKTILYEYNRY